MADGRRDSIAEGDRADSGSVGRAEEPDRHVHSEQSPDIAGIPDLHGDRLSNASKLLSVNLSTGAISNGGKILTQAAMLDVAGILFRGAPALAITVESVPSSGTLQLSTNENDEFVSALQGDIFIGEEIWRLYMKRTGSGTATLRLNALVTKDSPYNTVATS
jgi:hypothetical protein